MTPDYLALCAELLVLAEESPSYRVQDKEAVQLIDRARALLAEADGPAVPDGREPASVATQPSDAELLATINQAVADFPPRHSEVKAMTVLEYSLALELRKARAVLDRCGRPTPQPPADGEAAELAAELRHFVAGYQQMRGLDPEHVYSIHRGDAMEAHLRVSRLSRIAELLERPTPQPVAEEELEACIGWLALNGYGEAAGRLRAALALPTPEATND